MKKDDRKAALSFCGELLSHSLGRQVSKSGYTEHIAVPEVDMSMATDPTLVLNEMNALLIKVEKPLGFAGRNPGRFSVL